MRADGAGATREWLARITSGGGNKAHTWEYSVGWSRNEDFWTGLAKVPRRRGRSRSMQRVGPARTSAW
ncbi:hypothetical protein ACWCQZ_46715 [Streptomyces sp. NPDC002285]